jgi:SAM-dependent methyltransferase
MQMPRAPRANKAAPSNALVAVKDAEPPARRPRGRPRKEVHPGAIIEEHASQSLDLEELDRLEAQIDKTLEASITEIGTYLITIRDKGLYRVRGYETFSMYCKTRWNHSRHWAYRLIAATQILEIVSPVGDIPLPTTERQIRPLTPLVDNPEAVQEAWAEAVSEAGDKPPTPEQVRKAAAKQRQPQPVEKRSHGGTPHPAVYPNEVIEVMAELLSGFKKILDPFAGTGRIHVLNDMSPDFWDTVGIELEPEWAGMHERTKIGSALELPFPKNSFDAIATSPTYGNRFADQYDAADPEARRSYAFDLGRELSEDNSGAMQWGEQYRDFHEKAWDEILRVLKGNGRLVLNIKDHIRDGKWQDVAAWHVEYLMREGKMHIAALRPVAVGGMSLGSNSNRRSPAELVIALDKNP